MSATIPIPEGSVVITPLQMYQEQQEMNKTLGSVSNKIDAVVTKLDHYQYDQAKRMDAIDGKDGVLAGHDKRISSLERWRWVTTGAAVVLSSGATGLIEFLVTSHR